MFRITARNSFASLARLYRLKALTPTPPGEEKEAGALLFPGDIMYHYQLGRYPENPRMICTRFVR